MVCRRVDRDTQEVVAGGETGDAGRAADRVVGRPLAVELEPRRRVAPAA